MGMVTPESSDMPLVKELAHAAVETLQKQDPSFSLTVDKVLAFLNIELKKEDERQARELMKRRAGRVYGLYPELRRLLESFVEDGGGAS